MNLKCYEENCNENGEPCLVKGKYCWLCPEHRRKEFAKEDIVVNKITPSATPAGRPHITLRPVAEIRLKRRKRKHK